MASTVRDERQSLLSHSKDDRQQDWRHLSVKRKRVIVATALLTGFLSALDLTIVATCIATISSELHSADQEAWIGTAYLWSSVTFTPLYGRLSDLIGRRAAYIQAVFIFTVGTLGCGVAPSFSLLIASRFIAGMGGGGIGTVSSVLMADVFTPAEQGFYQGLEFAVWGAGTGLGGPIGGALTQMFGWRAAFYAQVPVAVVALVTIPIAIPGTQQSHYDLKSLRLIDFGGAVTLLISIGCLLQLLSRAGGSTPIHQDILSLFLAILSPVFFGAFIYVELKIAKRPVLPLSLLKRRTPLCVGIIAGVIAIVNFNMTYHLPMVFEIVFQQPLAVAGAHLLPNSIAMSVSAPIMGYICRRTLHFKWLTVLNCAGPLLSMAMFVFLREDSSLAAQWLSVVPMGLGFSGLLTLTLVGMLNSVDVDDIATATGFVFVWRSLGQVFGVGLSSAVFQVSLAEQLDRRFDSPDIIDKLRHVFHAIDDLPKAWQRDTAREAFRIALRNTFIFGLIGATLVFITSLFLTDDRLKGPEDGSIFAIPGTDEPPDS
ncbi:uncharacterized protein IL334_002242 [Kwoniella shivajii]|uniref:Major facilitator superfamily (MFS) profile domain-containing protein n=1 Tax=Kwoniella shivajii TaxID=564305 RepID=A0ABZ1CVV1_9TREE|nr:hypothetical protein IL334_002242 [Kwoniella shivajii]